MTIYGALWCKSLRLPLRLCFILRQWLTKLTPALPLQIKVGTVGDSPYFSWKDTFLFCGSLDMFSDHISLAAPCKCLGFLKHL